MATTQQLETSGAVSRITFGTATDPVGMRVEAAIAALGLTGPDSAYSRVEAGITNLNWLVFDGNRTVFLKLFGEGTHQFIDRAAASEASRIAGELGIAPKLLAYLPDLGAEAFEYLDGYRTMTAEEMQAPGPRAALIEAYRKIHAAGTISLTRTGFDQLESRVRLARQGNAPLPDDLDDLIAQSERARVAIMERGFPLCLCHNDSYTANYMINDAGDVRVIDWEYAANNDPAWDLSMMALAQPTPDAATTWARDYMGGESPALAARMTLYGAVALISWGLWAAQQTRISTIAFDYEAYSKTLFQFGRARLADPAWEAALCQL